MDEKEIDPTWKCPYFDGEEISEGLCWDIVHCCRGEFKKSACLEVKDWEKAKKLCSECPHQFA